MKPSIKKILIAGASLLMLASTGAIFSNIDVNACAVVYPYQYRMIKHTHVVRGTVVPHAKAKIFGDDETSGYVHGHRVIIGHDGSVLTIDGRRPTRTMFNKIFRHHTIHKHARHHYRRHSIKHHRRRAARSHTRHHSYRRY